MGHILIGQQGSHLLGFLRVLSGLVDGLLEFLLLHKAYASGDIGKTGEHVAKELPVDVIRMEHRTLFRGGSQQDDGMSHLIDGRKLHPLVAHGIRTASQHVVDTDAPHE